MERIQLINPDRISWCCADHGITVETLACEVGIAVTTLERVMTGKPGLTFSQLRKIADYFGRGVLFFLETDAVNAEQIHTLQFRTLSNQKPELSAKLKNLIERVEQQRNIYLNLREELKDSDHPRFIPPDLTGLAIAEAACIARDWLQLGAKNSFETYRSAVESQGVLVFRSNGYHGKWQIAKESPILGFTLYDADCPVIVIKKRYETQQSFTLMHELGHVLLHKASAIDDEQDFQSHEGRERDANAFAGHLLVPNDFLQQINDGERPDDVSGFDEWLDRPCKVWGVSSEMILRRLLDAGRLTNSQYVAYRNWRAASVKSISESGNRKYRHREPRHVFGNVFVRTVLDALDARHITLAKASSYLDNLKISDLHQLERHFADV